MVMLIDHVLNCNYVVGNNFIHLQSVTLDQSELRNCAWTLK